MNLISRLIVNWLRHEKPPAEISLSDFERIRYELKPCDVILVEGRTRISEVIKMVTQSSWSHAALYIGRLHDIEDVKFRAWVADHFQGDADVQLVIESLLGEGTLVRPLSVYDRDHLRICRPRGISYRDSQQAINFAISRLGLFYDIRQILDLARFLFPWWILPRRWRSSLFLHNPGRPTHTVCSTMLAEAFGYVQFPILPLVQKDEQDRMQLFRRNPKLCTPKDFDYSPYFEIIKYPFIDCCDYGTYRLLPWHGSGALMGDNAHLYMQPQHIQLQQAATELPEQDRQLQEERMDPLIEEILRADTGLARAPTEDMPIEDTELDNEDGIETLTLEAPQEPSLPPIEPLPVHEAETPDTSQSPTRKFNLRRKDK